MTSEQEGLYHSRAELYDLIYSFKNYEQEAQHLRSLLFQLGLSRGSRLLEGACGTAEHLRFLAQDFEVSGFDLSPEMIAQARAKLPDCQLFVADLRTIRVQENFDAFLCLFSSIGYLHSEQELQKAARSIVTCLRPGGVLVIEPWFSPVDFMDGHPSMTTYEDADIKICRQGVARCEGALSLFDFHWLVARRDQGVEYFQEHHALRLSKHEELLKVFTEAGFDVWLEKNGLLPGRGLLIGQLAL